MCEETLARFRATDWGSCPFIQMDAGVSDDRRARQTKNVWQALEWFLQTSDADFALLLEDDVTFNCFLRWNLERWSPMVDRRLHLGSLYNPNIRRVSEGDDYFTADPNACYGSQALVLSREGVSLCLRDWDTVAGMQDIKISRVIGGAGHVPYYHKPSLVEHLGTESCWGGGFHQASDFAATWKADFACERIPGWFTFPRFYREAVNDARDGDVLVEVGAWLGRSTAYLGRCIKASGKRIRLLVVDTFTGSSTEPDMISSAHAVGGSVRENFEENMRLADVLEVMEIKESRSLDAASVVPDRSCTLVFLDADHRYEAVRADIRAWRRKVRPGGLLAGHDCYTYAEVFDAVRDELGGQFVTTDENVWVHRVDLE